MLKRYIEEIGMIREGKGLTNSDKNTNAHCFKIAAPKPVRARPLGFTHSTQSKWIQASPVKTEDCDQQRTLTAFTENENKEDLEVK